MKKYRARIVVVLCLTLVLAIFTNCGRGGSGGGGASLVSSSQIDPKDLISIEGDYFLPFDNDRVVYLKINGGNISMELQQNYGGISRIQENEGTISVVGKNEFKIEYTKETCMKIGEEILKIKTGRIAGTLEMITSAEKTYVFYNTLKYALPAWVTSISQIEEDLTCSYQFFKSTSPSYTSGSTNVNNINSNYSMNGVSLNQVQQENPCISADGNADQANMQRQVIQTRIQVQTIPRGDIHVGVTSMGDVAAVIGDGTTNPMLVVYLCPRPGSGPGILNPQILVGATTNCAFKYITAANVLFPDGSQANFRALSPGGSSNRQKFSFCQE